MIERRHPENLKIPVWAVVILVTVVLNFGIGLIAYGRLQQRVDDIAEQVNKIENRLIAMGR